VLCPVCSLDQVIVEWGDVELDVCIDGCGIWFDAEELRHLFAAAGAPESVSSLERRLRELPEGPQGPRRRCPRCGARMEHVTTPHSPERIVLDRCVKGHGIWFDDGELEQLIDCEFGADDPHLAQVRDYLMQFLHPSAGEPSPTHNREPKA
jgi:Zn-finger nucleic acid-binding protein